MPWNGYFTFQITKIDEKMIVFAVSGTMPNTIKIDSYRQKKNGFEEKPHFVRVLEGRLPIRELSLKVLFLQFTVFEI